MNNFKRNNGISSVDCVMSITIITMMLGIIIVIYNNILLNTKVIDRRTEANRILVNIAENIDAIYYESFEKIYNKLDQNEFGEHYFIGGCEKQILHTDILAGYTLLLRENYEENNVEIKVEYTVNGEKQNISLTKFLNKEGN